jgi:hypothetical protein
MSHVRQQVRDAFKTALAGMTAVEGVHGIRTDPFSASELPAIQITTPTETIGPLDNTDVETDRDIQVDVSIWDLGDEGVDDKLDDIAAQIESRILNATGGIWDDGSGVIFLFPSSATMNLGELAEKTAVVLTTRFRVRLQASTPETIGD